MRVLLFDDAPASGHMVVETAARLGIATVAVGDAAAFRRHLAGDVPPLVILDLQSVSTDGAKLLRLMAARNYSGALVLMSGTDAVALDAMRALAQRLGLKLDCVLHKPLRVAEIERLLTRLRDASHAPTIGTLIAAIANGELVLEFQPIIRRSPRELRKLEALVRWEHPARGRIPPGAFVKLAESHTAAIDALTDWVVDAAIAAYTVLRGVGIGVPIAVNISPCNLHDPTLPDRIQQRLRAAGMSSDQLSLELTESAELADIASSMDILTRLRCTGMQIAIDDFGTGHASLNLLQRMPFSGIKIDRCFVADLAVSRASRAIVKSILDLAADMEMSCVVEGIETAEAADMIEQLGGHDLQGFFFARPMPIEAVHPWLAAWTRHEAT